MKKKAAVKKVVTKKPVLKADVKRSREELRKILATEKLGSDKAIKAATDMLPFIEEDAHMAKSRKVAYFPPVKREEVVRIIGPALTDKALKATAKEKEQAVKKVLKDSGLEVPQVTLAEICKELKLDPSEVRKALRAKKMQKPGAQWSWPKAEHSKVKDQVKKAYIAHSKDVAKP